MTKKWWFEGYGSRLLWLVVLAVIWEMIARFRIFNRLLFPTMETILHTLWQTIQSGEMIRATGLSLILIGEGLVIGVGLAIILAALAGSSFWVKGLVETLTVVAHPLPGIALLPLVILWLGTGAKAIVFIIIHSVLWPMLVNTLAGFRTIPKIYREIGANFGLSKTQIFWSILIPASVPYLLSGLKIGWARAWRAMISAEMVFGAAGGMGGLGWFIFQRRVFMDSPGIYAGIIVIIGIGMIVEEVLFSKMEQWMVNRWGMAAN